MADVDGDATAEILTDAGPGGGPHVRIWKIENGVAREVFGFFAYDPAFPEACLSAADCSTDPSPGRR